MTLQRLVCLVCIVEVYSAVLCVGGVGGTVTVVCVWGGDSDSLCDSCRVTVELTEHFLVSSVSA